jgi:hypothetical protein
LVTPWAVFDAFDGQSLIECKCGYDDIVDAAEGTSGLLFEQKSARTRLDEMIGQMLRHLDHARNCGWPYRVVVSSRKLENYLRTHGAHELNIETVESDMCD